MWSLVLSIRRRLARGEKDWRRWHTGMHYGIRSEQAIAKVCREVGEPLFRGCFGMTAVPDVHCVGRAVGLEAHRPLLSTDTVQINDRGRVVKGVGSVGFLPGRKVFLPHEGEKQGRKYFCHSFCHFCRGEMAEIIKT